MFDKRNTKRYREGWAQGYDAGKAHGELNPITRPSSRDDWYSRQLIENVKSYLRNEQELTASLRRENQFLQDRIDQLIACGVSR